MKPPVSVTIEQLLAATQDELELRSLAGRAGLERAISVPRVQKPGLALTGYREQLHSDRLLVLGGTEIGYLEGVSEPARRLAVDTLLAASPACLVVTRGLEPPPALRAGCARDQVPILVSALSSADFITRVSRYLQEQMAPCASIHGVLLDVLGIGILLLGKSGIGKSEIALDLVVRGHRLVADDVVNLRYRGSNVVYGSGAGIIRHHMEIRGLGIINIKDLFGISSVRETKKIELVIELSEWDENQEYDRLGLDEEYYQALDVDIPKLRLPVRPGRTMATIIEVAARNQLLKLQGYHSAREFHKRVNRAIVEARPSGYDIDVIE